MLNGSLALDAAFGSLIDDNLVLSAAGTGGNITVGAVGISAASFNLNAAGSIQGGGNLSDLTATAGSIILSADQDIGTGLGGTPLAVLTQPGWFCSSDGRCGQHLAAVAGANATRRDDDRHGRREQRRDSC